jgi:hypothetical protein
MAGYAAGSFTVGPSAARGGPADFIMKYSKNKTNRVACESVDSFPSEIPRINPDKLGFAPKFARDFSTTTILRKLPRSHILLTKPPLANQLKYRFPDPVLKSGSLWWNGRLSTRRRVGRWAISAMHGVRRSAPSCSGDGDRVAGDPQAW